MDYTETWEKHFLPKSIRPIQAKALVKASTILDAGKNVIAELPTGTGKSYIAHALASASKSGYVITSDNLLVKQYERDFKEVDGFEAVMGRRNYTCATLEKLLDYEGDTSCLTGSEGWYDEDTKRKRNCKCTEVIKDKTTGDILEWPTCPYAISRLKAIMAPVAFSNSSYYATAMRFDEAWMPRKLTIFDEAHSLEGSLLSLVEVSIGRKALTAMNEEGVNVDVYDFRNIAIEDNFIPFKGWKKSNGRPLNLDSVADLAEDIVSEIDVIEENNASIPYERRTEGIKTLSTLRNNLRRFLETRNSIPWVADLFEYEPTDRDHKYYGPVRFLLKPVILSTLTKGLIFSQANQFVFQSATIIDGKQFAEDLAIPNWEGFAFKSPFPAKNRPVYPLSVGSLSQKNFQENIKLCAAKLEQILEARKDQKGIVHTTSYAIQKYLKENLKHNPRYLFPETDDKLETLEVTHALSKEPTVLFSPAMTQGVDLHGHLARFCVVFKIAYPYLGDRCVKKRKELSDNWYMYATAKTFIQAIGRGVRSEDDWCDIFIIDSAFYGLYKNYGKLENYLKDVIEWDKDKCEKAIRGTR